MTDPLAAFATGAFVAHTRHPIPCIGSCFDVDIEAGLAVVQTRRRFRNDEAQSIEATITFPIPVHATLFSLNARIDGRTLSAHARRRADARRSYEEAIEDGKTTVLHEELLRGVHMLSVAHIPPGAEVEVTSSWVKTLSSVGGSGSLRIPLTVGDIYGRSPLPASDELIHGGPNQMAELTVRSSDGKIRLAGGLLKNGRAQVGLNRPIDLRVDSWKPRDLVGRAADGRKVVLRIEPLHGSPEPVNLALLVDRSGSMASGCSGMTDDALSKHQAVVRGLRTVARRLEGTDWVDVWEFDDALNHIGTTETISDTSLEALAGRLSTPRGGTEIGAALSGVLARSQARDVLLVTDGKSHALDVQSLARFGRRISVVLVGEDSLEANVGHLTALTGGDIFVASGDDVIEMLTAAFQSLRQGYAGRAEAEIDPTRLTVKRGNNLVSAMWEATTDQPETGVLSRAVSAMAASLVLNSLNEDRGGALAEAEGLVTHLTSLVLVDDAGGAQEGAPAMRKIPLPDPEVAIQAFLCSEVRALGTRTRFSISTGARPRFDSSLTRKEQLEYFLLGYLVDLSEACGRLDWDVAPQKLIEGKLSSIDSQTAKEIRRAARTKPVIVLAKQHGLTAIVLIVGLMALLGKPRTRTSARIAKAILGAHPSPVIIALGRLFNLQS